MMNSRNEKYNGAHGIYGEIECFHQSDYKPGWLIEYGSKDLLYKITLEN